MTLNARLEVRLSGADLALWDAAATRAGLSLSEFVRTTVNGTITATAVEPAQQAPVLITPPVEAAPAIVPSPVTTPPPAASRCWPFLCPSCRAQGAPTCSLCRQLNGLAA
jgi:hypothetical protein